VKRPNKPKCESVEYVGKHERFRIRLYDDGSARLCFRAVHWGSIRTVGKVNGWRFVGDFSPEMARHITGIFVGNIDRLANLQKAMAGTK
jgi:hypothetical protein